MLVSLKLQSQFSNFSNFRVISKKMMKINEETISTLYTKPFIGLKKGLQCYLKVATSDICTLVQNAVIARLIGVCFVTSICAIAEAGY